MKKILNLLIIMILISTNFVFAEGNYIEDNSNTFSFYEIQELNNLLSEIHDKYNINAVVYFGKEGITEREASQKAQDYYNNKYGVLSNGIIMYVDLGGGQGNRRLWIHKNNEVDIDISGSELNYMLDRVVDKLASGDMYNAVIEYISLTKSFYNSDTNLTKQSLIDSFMYDSSKSPYVKVNNGDVFRYDYKTKPILAFIISSIIASLNIIILVIKNKGNLTINNKTYEKKFKIIDREDKFIRTKVTKTKKSSSSSGGRSGGRSSGGGRSF